MRLGYKQQRAVDFLRKRGTPQYFNYRTAENRRIVDSLEKRGLVSVFHYPPDACRDVLVSLADCN